MEFERIREQRRRFELEMQKLDQQQRREAQELAQMEEEIVRLGGPQSEPTTPPEYRDHNSGFPSMFSRPNRYSTSSLTSPPGLFNRPGRSGSQVTSPPSGIMQPRYGYDEPLPSRSVPTTRRNSDDEKEEAVRQDPSSHRSGNAYVTAPVLHPILLGRESLNGQRVFCAIGICAESVFTLTMRIIMVTHVPREALAS